MTSAPSCSTGCILVCEASANWLPELQRRFPQCVAAPVDGADQPVPEDDNDAVGDVRLLVLDACAVAGQLRKIAELGERFSRRTDILILLPCDDLRLEWELRDWGATSVVQGGDREAVLRACRQLLWHEPPRRLDADA